MKRLAQSSVGTGSGTLLYTVPTAFKTNVTNIDVANTSSSPIDFSLHLVPSGGSASASNMLFPAVTIPGNTMVQWEGTQHMTAAGFIQGIGSASGITVNITGDEIRDKV